MLLTRLRRLARSPGSGFTAVDGPVDPEVLGADGVFTEAEAEVVEGVGGRLRAIAVGAPTASRFTSFLDGIQRSSVALYHGPVPIVHAYAAAVVRSRRARRMGTLCGAENGHGLETRYHEEREALFFPFELVDRTLIAAAGVPPDQMEDTGGGEALPLFPPALYARAEARINRWREDLEIELAERWCLSGDDPGWLLVDGSLTQSSTLAACPRAVGVIKGHRTRFFDGDDARILLGLRAGERTSVFQPKTRRFTPVYSWYLRLRSAVGRDVFWGLVRVEVAADEASLARADEISRWLLAETSPLALPDARWDRLLYPIRDCEQFLRSRAPNIGGE